MKALLLLVLIVSTGVEALAADIPVIARWRGGKKAAVSYTFDDGMENQYTEAFPKMKELGLRGTFFINGGPVDRASPTRQGAKRMTWTMVAEMAKTGQEIGCHGYEHRNHGKFPEATIEADILSNRVAIVKATGSAPITYAYPNNAKNREWSAALLNHLGFVGSRTRQISLGGKRDLKSADKLVADAKAKGEWLVTMTHGISEGYDRVGDPAKWFYAHLEHTAADPDVWVAPFAEVAIYEALRDHTKISPVKTAAGWQLNVTPPDLDPKLYRGTLDILFPDGHIETIDPFNDSTNRSDLLVEKTKTKPDKGAIQKMVD